MINKEIKTANVVGAGILGLAFARALAERNYQVTVFERSIQASGSSIRNFGMVWPIGQKSSTLLDRALKSRSIWIDICEKGNIWFNRSGSLQLLANEIEWQLANEFYEHEKSVRNGLKILDIDSISNLIPNLNSNVLGALYSDTEIIVESREAMRQLPRYLKEKYNINFHFNCLIHESHNGKLKDQYGRIHEADLTIIASGYETQLLYPQFFQQLPYTVSSLNMLRSKEIDHRIPALCAGLSFLHYSSYEVCKSLMEYEKYCALNYADLLSHGIHLLISQNHTGQLTIGDSHQYGMHHDPFQADAIDSLILDYMQSVFNPPDFSLAQRWTGQYLKLTNGKSELFEEVEPGVYIANGPGGAGMTLGWGMAEENVAKI